MRYEIQTFTVCDGWVNTWLSWDDKGNVVPETFDSYADASMELDDFLNNQHDAYEQGWMESKYRPEEFRIMEIV